jgi:transposase
MGLDSPCSDFEASLGGPARALVDQPDRLSPAADPIRFNGIARIERMFCRLKDSRRIATRYDKLARNFLAGVLIAAVITWWLN